MKNFPVHVLDIDFNSGEQLVANFGKFDTRSKKTFHIITQVSRIAKGKPHKWQIPVATRKKIISIIDYFP